MTTKRFVTTSAALLALSISMPSQAGWFGVGGSKEEETQQERERRIHAEAQKQALQVQQSATETRLLEQQRSTSSWQSVALALGIACPVLLIVGAALGAASRRRINGTG